MYKWLIIERFQPINKSVALRFIERSIMFMNADVEYLDFNTSTELYKGFDSHLICPSCILNLQSIYQKYFRDKIYKMYKIYRGGKLITHFDRYLIIDTEENVQMTASIHAGKSSYDVTLRVGIVVHSRFLNTLFKY